jgi:hypothetical protein
MLPLLRAGLAATAVLVAPVAAFAEPSVSIVPLGFAVSEFRAPGSRVATLVATTDALRENRSIAGQPLAVVWGDGGGAALALKNGAIVVLGLASRGDLAALERGRDAAPGSHSAASGPLSVTFTRPAPAEGRTTLGSASHPTELTIVERRPVVPGPDPKPVPTATSRVSVGQGAVFEDRTLRLADLDQDGTPEIVTITSRPDKGASLAIVARRGEGWAIVAETPAADRTSWLNPAAIGAFTGTRPNEIALVREPEGVVEVWAYDSGGLKKVAEKAGYANHAPGYPAQDLAAAFDLDGDGRLELAVPTLDRRSLAILRLTGGITETARIALPGAVTSGVAVLGAGRAAHLLVGLEDGRVADIRP